MKMNDFSLKDILDAIDWHMKHRMYGCIFLSNNNIEKIKKNAPNGATHYEIDGDDVWYYAKCYNECCWLDFSKSGVLSGSESPLLDESKLKPLY